ncbi:MAG: hypothetical protein ACLU99_03365 [Alphaproteobacteria bacterium]
MLPAVNELDVDLFVIERQQTLEEDKIISLASFQPVHVTVRHSGRVGGLFKLKPRAKRSSRSIRPTLPRTVLGSMLSIIIF